MDLLEYKITFKNAEDVTHVITTQDTDTIDPLDPSQPVVTTDLEGKDQVAILESIDNDDDKTRAIRGRRMQFGFNSDDTTNVETFADGEEDRFKVLDELTLFEGYLSLADVAEAFQPRPNPMGLIATDMLAGLKEIEFSLDDETLPIGRLSIMLIVKLCLRKTGHDHPINVVMNLYEESTNPDTTHSWDTTYVDSTTYEKEINEREDCLTVLTKILEAFGCFVTNYAGEWWIIRWDEYDAVGVSLVGQRVAHFDSDGLFINFTTENLQKVIASDYHPDYEGFYLSLDNAVRRYDQRCGEVKHFLNYEYPKEIICNIEFIRGTERVESPAVPATTEFDIDCWTMFRGLPNVANDGDAFIRREYDTGVEIARYVVLAVQPSLDDYYIESQPVPVMEKDRFDFSVDLRYDGQVETVAGLGTTNAAQIRLYGNDGSHWILDPGGPTDDRSFWILSDATWSTNNRFFVIQYDGTDDDTEWRTATFWDSRRTMSPDIPTDGEITILLHQTKKSNQFETQFSNLRFTYKPYINGTYALFTGQQHKVTGTAKKKKEKQMFIGDAPRLLMKGSMSKLVSLEHVLTGNWLDYISPAPMTLGEAPLGKWIVFQWWNQFRKTRTIIETSIQGMNTGNAPDLPGLIHDYSIKVGGLDDKKFMLLSHSQDLRLNEWSQSVLVETSSAEGDRVYTDDYEFKYITG